MSMANNPPAAPTAWELFGSSDGLSWTKLDEQTGQTFSQGQHRSYSL